MPCFADDHSRGLKSAGIQSLFRFRVFRAIRVQLLQIVRELDTDRTEDMEAEERKDWDNRSYFASVFSASQKRWPVFAMKTSSSDGLPSDTEVI